MPEFEWQFTLVLLTNGIMIGLMYALIALGFVLIYKATDAINFAQGEFVMFAGFLTAGAAELAGFPFWASALIAIGGMIALGFGLERVVLRPMIGRPVIAVVMATIGLAAVLRGTATRAVADSQQVSMAMGINVRRYFALAWAMAGVVSALGGIVWGTMLSVDNQLALVGLKVFPVVI